MTEGALRNLLVDGIVAGAGGVLLFLQIVILFAFIRRWKTRAAAVLVSTD